MLGHIDRRQRPLAAQVGRKNSLTIIADCRLDNREELNTQLGFDDELPASPSDSDLILAAYRKWGTKTPEYLLGDFAFAITDPESRSMFCARDHIGIAPLYYCLSDDAFVVSGIIRDIVCNSPEPVRICDDAVAIYLRDGELYHDRLTFVEGIEKLPPAHAMLVTKSSVSKWAYWRPEDSPRIREKSRDRYISRLRELLEEAVKCRLPAGETVGLHLSGGLDSSSLTALAARLSAKVNCSLVTYSWLAPPKSAKDALEPEWLAGKTVADQYGLPINYESFGPDQLLELLESHNIASGDTCDCWYEFGVRDKAAENNISALITGWGGDQFISHHGSGYHLQIFTKGRLFVLLRDFWLVCKTAKKPIRSFLGVSYSQLIKPWISISFGKPQQLLEYIGAATESVLSRAQDLPREFLQYRHSSVRAQQLSTNDRLHLNSRILSWSISGQRAGIEYRYPLLDKRVVEFALGIPPDLYRSGGTSRYIFRHAIKDILPEEVWSGRKDGTEPVRLQRGLETCIGALALWNEKHGCDAINSPFIDGAKLKSILDDISKREPILDIDTYRAVATAIKSILVLNMSVETSRL